MRRILKLVSMLVLLLMTGVAGSATESLFSSLPAEAQKNIEEVRTSCRVYWNGWGILSDGDVMPLLVSSGDEGLISLSLSGAQAVMVSDLRLCSGSGGRWCLRGTTCSNNNGSSFEIYVRTGQALRKALSTVIYDPEFLSFDDNGTFKAMVLTIRGDDKDCPPKRRMFIRTHGLRPDHARCNVIVRWTGTKFTYEAL
jgi:hypothetical protein